MRTTVSQVMMRGGEHVLLATLMLLFVWLERHVSLRDMVGLARSLVRCSRPRPRVAQARLERLEAATHRLQHRLLPQARCLHQALALRVVLGWLGQPVTFWMGLHHPAQLAGGHAWLVVAGDEWITTPVCLLEDPAHPFVVTLDEARLCT